MNQSEFLGSYRMLRPLGSASSSYLVQRRDSEELAVLKIFSGEPVDAATWGEIARQFRDSPSRQGPVCLLSEVGLKNDEVFAVAPYLQGENLAQVIKAITLRREISHDTSHHRAVAGVMAELVEGVMSRGSEDFEHPVFDRDMVTPQELFVLREGRGCVLDARWSWLRARISGSPWSSLERNLAYLAPPTRVPGRPLDAGRSWALGVMLWEMLVGYRLFRRGTLESTLQAISGSEVPDPRSINPTVPKALALLVMRTLAVPGGVSLAEMHEELLRAAGVSGVEGEALVRKWLAELFPGDAVRLIDWEAVPDSLDGVTDSDGSDWSVIEESTTCIAPPPTLRAGEVVHLSWLEDEPAPRMAVVRLAPKGRRWGFLGALVALCVSLPVAIVSLLGELAPTKIDAPGGTAGGARHAVAQPLTAQALGAADERGPLELRNPDPPYSLPATKSLPALDLASLPVRADEVDEEEWPPTPVRSASPAMTGRRAGHAAGVSSQERTGDLLVRTGPTTSVSLAGERVGTGSFRLRLPEGEHLLRLLGPRGKPAYILAHVRAGALAIVDAD